MSLSPNHSRRLIVLGSTGSIGTNTLNVVDHLNDHTHTPIKIVGLAAGRSIQLLVEQAQQHNVQHVAIADPSAQQQLESALPGVTVYTGPDAALRLVETVEATDVAAAIVGAAGLPPTLAAIQRGQRISLANKETLVAAGGLVKPLIEQHHATLLPVDSEHSAIFQCLANHPHTQVKRIVLTASGGPFRTTPLDQIQNATVAQALNHPTWNMGKKISIDSATMMNKALEIIEAYWLFDLPWNTQAKIEDVIRVVVHPQSIVHSFVEFTDHSILAQLGPPDMRTPIQYALTYPDRVAGCSDAMDWPTLSKMTFEPPDFQRFPALKLAYRVVAALRQGHQTAGAIFNGANEAAVAAFLEHRIRFGRIVQLVGEAIDAIDAGPIHSLTDVLTADQAARDFVETKTASLKPQTSSI